MAEKSLDEIIDKALAEVPRPSPAQVRAVRNFFGWTQVEAGNLFGIGRSTLIDYEREGRTLPDTSVAKIGLAMKGLGIKFDGDKIILPLHPPKLKK